MPSWLFNISDNISDVQYLISFNLIQFAFPTPFVFRLESLLSVKLLSKFLDVVVGSFAAPAHKERSEMALSVCLIDHLGQLLLPRSLNFMSA